MEKEEHSSIAGGIANWYTLEINLEVPQKIENRSFERPALPLLGIYPKDVSLWYKDTCYTMFMEALFVTARNWKQPRCPIIEEWIQKMWFIYTMGYCSAIKNEDILSFAGKWMELENLILLSYSTEVHHPPQALPHQSSIKKSSHRPIWWGHFLN